MQNHEILRKAYVRKIISRGVLKQAVIRGRITEDEYNEIMLGSPFPEDAGRVYSLSSKN